MSHREPPRTPARRIRSAIFAAVVIVSAALIDVAAAPIDLLHGATVRAVIGIDSSQPTKQDPSQPHESVRPNRRETALGAADGVVPDGVTVFDDQIPAVANLNPALLGALRQAATAAADDGIEFVVNSGWRSPAYQDELLREAVAEYGSEEEAARWVATARTSRHVSGDAVDLGPVDAAAWLSAHGAGYGLCQIYRNEPWHFELRPEAVDDGCPPMYADPTQDPRMQP
jgi:zinc D-Ala-D-Ala carboxypeptidase